MIRFALTISALILIMGIAGGLENARLENTKTPAPVSCTTDADCYQLTQTYYGE